MKYVRENWSHSVSTSHVKATVAGGIIPAWGPPSGSVTFVFTDVEGSTPLFRELGSQFVGLLEDHNRIVRTAVAEHHGYEVRTEGDAFFLAFSDPVQAIATCLDAQLAIARHRWPVDRALRVRMGLHTGEAEPTGDGDYVALPVHQAARVSSAAHGGQVLLSEQTAGLLRGALPPGAGLADRGSFQLKGFDQPQQLYQLTFPGLADHFPPLRAAPAIPNNLPNLRTTFVGRDTELPTLEELIAANRLVSVVGPGGAGKTRLSLELAARNASSFQAGAHLADLSPLAEPALVPSAIAAAFGIREEPGTDLLKRLGGGWTGAPRLLVMDNCEHLIGAAAEAVERLLETVDGVRLLVTSREALALPGELIWRLTPLSVVDADATAEQVRSCDAGRLFEERAALSRVGYTVSSADAEHVAAICRALEGLPLAIELAAARVSTMSLERMAAQLGRRDAVLGFGSRRGRGRHASLESTIDWSYQLLDEAEQQTLRALSIFVAGFTAAAAERIVGLASLLDHLAALVDKSLIVYDEDADRYRLLESIREFARIRLDGEGEAETVGSAHLRWYADVATSSLEQSMTSRDVETFAMVDREIDNFRAAMVFAENHADPRGLELVAGLHAYWSYRAPAEARLWTDRLLVAVPQAEPLQIAYALATRADSEFMTGGIERPLRDSARAVALARTSGQTLALMRCLMTRALVTFAPGDGESRAGTSTSSGSQKERLRVLSGRGPRQPVNPGNVERQLPSCARVRATISGRLVDLRCSGLFASDGAVVSRDRQTSCGPQSGRGSNADGRGL